MVFCTAEDLWCWDLAVVAGRMVVPHSVTPVSPSKPLFPGTAIQFNTRVAQEGKKLTDPLERELVPPGWAEGVAEGASKA